MHRIAALFVVILLVISGGGNLADPAPVTPAPLLPLPGTPQPPDPLNGFRGLQPASAAVTPSAPNTSRFDLPQWDQIYSDDFESLSSDSPWMRPLDRYLAHESGNQFVRITGDGTRLPLSFGYIHDTSLEARVRIQSGTLRVPYIVDFSGGISQGQLQRPRPRPFYCAQFRDSAAFTLADTYAFEAFPYETTNIGPDQIFAPLYWPEEN